MSENDLRDPPPRPSPSAPMRFCGILTSPSRRATLSPSSALPAPASPRCCGVSTCWRPPAADRSSYHGTDVAGRGVNAPAYRSHVGMVFQSFNLFNNMTVLKNCMVGQVKVLKRSKEEARATGLEVSGKGGYGPLYQRQAPADLRRPEAAGGHRPRPGHGARRCCCSTSPPPRWTPRWWARCCTSCGIWPRRA